MHARSAPCPECGAPVRLLGRLLIGEVVGCNRCAAQLEVAASDPLILEPLARIEDEDEVRPAEARRASP
jgi:lysine biosynthesis protein LysW